MSASGITASGRTSVSKPLSFTPAEWSRIGGLYSVVVLLHLTGWGLYLFYSRHYPALVGFGLVAYLFGLRHAFDADHIAAIDNTVRSMLQKKRSPLGIGFFFSLGHSTIVFGLAVTLTFAAAAVKTRVPQLENMGSVFGVIVSGVFLWIMGVLNLLVLFDILKVWKRARMGSHNHDHLEEMLAKRGLINRLLGQRYLKFMNHSWQMYPVGLLFGLGFDTATEIGLLAMTAGAAAGALPWPAVLSLPLLFTAGMTIMDTTDGVLMTKAYNWAFINPLRKIFYNLTTTSLSIVVALVIGTIELLQVPIGELGLNGGIFDVIGDLDFGDLGFIVVGLFMMAWIASLSIWKFGRIEKRFGHEPRAHAHKHVHQNGTTHTHKHLH